MKEKRHARFGGALKEGNKLKYITSLVLEVMSKNFLFLKETPARPSSSCIRKAKNNNYIRLEKLPA